MRTKIFTLFLALAASVGTMFAAYVTIDGITYNLNDQQLTAEVESKSGGKYYGSIVIPESINYNTEAYSVTSIGIYAFGDCTDLTSVTIPNSVKSIGTWAFSRCTGLTSVTIPNSLTSIGGSAFIGCSGLNSIIVDKENPNYDSRDNCNAIIETSTNTLIVGCENTTIPNSVTSIGNSAFSGCSGLTSIEIPNSVTSIGDYAFRDCIGLTSVMIGNSVTSIGGMAFADCSSLTSVEIPNSVTSIDFAAFEDCASLTSVTIGNSVTSIGSSAFYGCTGLTSVTIPNSVTSIGGMAFADCSSLTSIIWNAKNCSDFSSNDTPFYYYLEDLGFVSFDIRAQITSFTFGSEVKHIPAYLCYGMTKLTSIELPNKVTSIGESAFYNCKGLKTVTIDAKTPPTLGSSTFLYTNNCPIYVPCGTLDAYKKAWSDYSSQIKYVPLEYAINGDVNEDEWGYLIIPQNKCDGIIAIPNYGYHFAQWSDGNTDNPRTFVLTQDTTFTAEFAKNAYKITTESSNRECGTTLGDTTALYLDEIAISAVANYGYYFAKWSDGNTNNPRTITVIENKKYQAIFAKNVYSVTKITQPEQGSISGVSQAEYLDNVTLTANPNYGYHFAQWSDGNTDNPRTFVLTHDTIFNAEFAKNEYTITTESIELGWGTFECVNSALYLDEIAISAIPNYGYHFAQWSDGNTDNPRTITIIQDTTFQAVFAKNAYFITKNAEHGTIAGNDYAKYLDEVTLTVNPDYGYHFAQWSDGNTDNPRTFVLTQDTTFTAEFAKNEYSITMTSNETGWGTIEGVNTALYLDEIAISAIPNYGYHFAQWNDGNTDNPRTITIIRDTTFQAVFAKNTYFITKNAEHGTIAGNDYAKYLDEVTLIVNPDYGYHFAQWSDDNTDNPRTFVLTQDTTFTAELAINQYSISVTCDDVRGSIEGENGVFDYLTEKTYEVIPNYGYHFAQWSDGNTDNPRTITITQDISISAVLAKNTYTIIDNSDPTQGYIYGAGTYEYLDEIVLIPVNEYGYHFIQWSDGLTDSKQTIVLTKDTTFAAEFAIDKSGTCGANNMLNWVFDDQEKVLTISGSGRLDDNYTYGIEAPTQMKKLIIGDNISIIGNSAFYDCSRLMKIYFGKAIETIGSNAFRKCPYILEIHAPMEFPPIIDESVFAECGNLGGIDCYVSEESLSLYKKTDVWSSFNLLVESSHEAIDNISVDNHKTTKLLRDGQLLILRGEKVYTVTGQEVK